MRLILAFLLMAAAALAQIATIPVDQAVTVGLRGGSLGLGASLTIETDAFSAGLRTGPHGTGDVFGTVRLKRFANYDGGLGRFLDFGVTTSVGTFGPKVAAVGGLLFGDGDVSFFLRGGLGNERFGSAGMNLGRMKLFGVYGNYWENRAAVEYSIGRGFSANAGWSSALGWNAGLAKTWQ